MGPPQDDLRSLLAHAGRPVARGGSQALARLAIGEELARRPEVVPGKKAFAQVRPVRTLHDA